MGSTLGNLQAGPLWADVFLDGAQGDTLSISLAEESDSDTEWECVVRVRCEYGAFTLGMFRTRSPARGQPPARVVAICHFPGAVQWSTSWRSVAGSNPSAAASAILASRDCCAGTLPGVTPLLVGPFGPFAPRTFVRLGSDPAGPFVAPVWQITQQPGAVLFHAQMQMNKPEDAQRHFAMFFDLPVAPVGGEIPIWSRAIGPFGAFGAAPVEPSWADYDAGPQGIVIRNFLWAAISQEAGFFQASGHEFTAYAELALP